MYLLIGLKNTLIITLGAIVIGTLLGILIAFVKFTYHNRKKWKLLNNVCELYTTIIRGTPVIVQLMILYFCVLTSRDINGVMVSIIGFGLNSGAYVAEIFRGGLISIDKGQMEAGLSLGLSYNQTVNFIILPQAFRNVLPALCNEFIALVKETSIVGCIAVHDITRGGDLIKSYTYDAWTSLFLVATIYLIISMTIGHLAKKIELKLRKYS